jgi:hypothetical protein
LPLIIEVWDKQATNDEFMGLARIPLDHTYEILYDEVYNEINTRAIKNNVYPVMICDDTIGVKDIKSKTETGSLQIIVAIGTPAQISKFESRVTQPRTHGYYPTEQTSNQRSWQHYEADKEHSEVPSEAASERLERDKKTSGVESTPKELSEIKSEPRPTEYEEERVSSKVPLPQIEDTLRNEDEIFVAVLRLISKNISRINGEYRYLFEDIHRNQGDTFSVRQFMDFLAGLQVGVPLVYSARIAELLDIESKNEIRLSDFLGSWKSYQTYEALAKRKVSDLTRKLHGLLSRCGMSVVEFETTLMHKSSMGFISIASLNRFLEELNGGEPVSFIEQLAVFVEDPKTDDFVFVAYLGEYLKMVDKFDMVNEVRMNVKIFKSIVMETIQNLMKTLNETRLENILSVINADEEHRADLGIWQAMEVFNREGVALSFIEVYILFSELAA